MRQVLLCIAMCLLATSISGMPQGHDRPGTIQPQKQRTIDEFMCEVLNNCNNTSQSSQPRPDQTQPDETQPDQPQPDQPQLQVQPDNAAEENLSQICRCVLYYKCKSRKRDKSTVTISSTGRRVEKCNYLQVCCDDDIIETEPTKPSVTDEQAAPL